MIFAVHVNAAAYTAEEAAAADYMYTLSSETIRRQQAHALVPL